MITCWITTVGSINAARPRIPKPFLDAHGTYELLITGHMASFIVRVAYITPVRKTLSGVMNPAMSSC